MSRGGEVHRVPERGGGTARRGYFQKGTKGRGDDGTEIDSQNRVKKLSKSESKLGNKLWKHRKTLGRDRLRKHGTKN